MVTGPISYDYAKPAGEHLPSIVYQDLDVRYRNAAGQGLGPEGFGGSVGVGGDDTDAFLAWFDVLKQGSAYGVLTPGTTYNIESGLIHDQVGGSDIIVNGRGATIEQHGADDIFRFTVENLENIQIRNLKARWTNQQGDTDGTAFAKFTCTTDAYLGWHHNLFEDIELDNAYQGLRTVNGDGHINIVWATVFNRVKANYGCTGSLMQFSNGLGGQTGLHIMDCYQHRETVEGEPVLKIAVADDLTIDDIKMDGENTTANRGIVLESVTGARLSGRQERGNFADGDSVVYIKDGNGIFVSHWSIQAPQSYTGASHSVFELENTQGFSLRGGGMSHYSPHPAPPATLAWVDWSASPGFAPDVVAGLDGSAVLARPNLPAAGGSIPDNSISPSKLVNGGTSPGVGKVYENGRWVAMTGGGGSSAPTVRKGTIGGIGNSLVAISPSYSTTQDVNTHLGIGGHGAGDYLFNALIGLGIDLLGTAATVGQTAQYIRDNHLPTILAMRPQYCWNWCNIANNALAAGELTTDMLALEKYILDQQIAAGITPIVGTMPPASNSTNTGLSVLEVQRFNAWIYDYAMSNGCYFVDFWNELVDPTTSSYRTTPSLFSTDNTHPSAYGAAAIVPVLRKVLESLPEAAPTRYNLAGINTAYSWQAANPLLAGTIGANAPTGWSTTNLTNNLAASSTYKGNEWEMVGTSAFGTAYGPPISGGVNKKWELSVRMATTPSAGGGFGLYLYDQGGNLASVLGQTTGAMPYNYTMDKPLVLRGKFASGDSQLTPLLFTVGPGSRVKIAQFTFRTTSDMGIGL